MSDLAAVAGLMKVVLIKDPFEVVVNRGLEDGVRLGDVFLVYGLGPEIKDPDSGRHLGRLELPRGRGKVVHVQPGLATLRSVEVRKGGPRRRIVKRGLPGLTPLFPDQFVEEEIGEDQELPFRDPEPGDLAREV